MAENNVEHEPSIKALLAVVADDVYIRLEKGETVSSLVDEMTDDNPEVGEFVKGLMSEETNPEISSTIGKTAYIIFKATDLFHNPPPEK